MSTKKRTLQSPLDDFANKLLPTGEQHRRVLSDCKCKCRVQRLISVIDKFRAMMLHFLQIE